MQGLTYSIVFGILLSNLVDCAIFDLRPTASDVVSVYTTNHPGEHDTSQTPGVYTLILRNVFQRFVQPIYSFFYSDNKEKHDSNIESVDADDVTHIRVIDTYQHENLDNSTAGAYDNAVKSSKFVSKIVRENLKAHVVNETNVQNNNTTILNRDKMKPSESEESSEGRQENSKFAAIKFATEFVGLNSSLSNDSLVEEVDGSFQEEGIFSAEVTTRRYSNGPGVVSGDFLIRFVELVTSALAVAMGALSTLVFRSLPRWQKMDEE